VDNVIVRNVRFEDAHDCFPSWDPTDGATGNWNSLYDTMSVITSTHVWADHDTFSDGGNRDDAQPLYFGRPYQVHDGLLDITKASDLVTVENTVFADHDKTMLIGSSDSATADAGKLRVTVHHDKFANVGQRAPRVRYGQVDVYDNYYVLTDEDTYSYSLGIGVRSAIYAENNFFLRSADVPVGEILHGWGGTAMTERGSVVRVGSRPPVPVSLLDAYNAAHDPDIAPDAGWTPVLRSAPADPAVAVPAIVGASAGAGRLRL
jgi:pectate lyase